MKKIAFLVALLAACVAMGRAQESRQDISLSGIALIEPFMASSTTVQVQLHPRLRRVAQLPLYASPTNALEANYGITYQNSIGYYINPQPLQGPDPHPGDVGRSRALFRLQELESVCGGRPIRPYLPAHHQLRHHDSRSQAADRGRRHLRRRLRLRDQPQLRHPGRISWIGHQGPHLRRLPMPPPTAGTTISEPTVGIAYHF